MYRINDTQAHTSDGTEVTVLEVIGHVDNVAAQRLKEALQRIYSQGRNRVVVDCAQLDFIASAGIGAIFALVHQFRARGGDVKVASMSEKVGHVFDLLGLRDVLETFPSVPAATAKFVVKPGR